MPQVSRIIGHEITAVDSLGKNLLIRFDNGLAIRTHLRMNGSWHRYRPGEPWRRPPARARLVLEVPGAVAVCFDAPVVELLEARAEALHPPLGTQAGPAGTRVRCPRCAARGSAIPPGPGPPIAEALLDQRALAGIGNVYKNELLCLERVSPFTAVADLDDATLARLVVTARRLMLANVRAGRGPARVTTGRRPPCAWRRLRLRPSRAPLPAMRDDDPKRPAGQRPPPDDLLVPVLPGGITRTRAAGVRPVSIAGICVSTFIARAAEPFAPPRALAVHRAAGGIRDRRLRLGCGVARPGWPPACLPRHSLVPR